MTHFSQRGNFFPFGVFCRGSPFLFSYLRWLRISSFVVNKEIRNEEESDSCAGRDQKSDKEKERVNYLGLEEGKFTATSFKADGKRESKCRMLF